MSEAIQTEWSGHHEAKDRLRSQVWTALKTQGAAVGDPVGHIPRFVGAEQAAEHLAALPCWRQAQVVKCNPDRVQEPVRLRALQDGKRLYMAVPRLTKPRCFVALEAADLCRQGVELAVAATQSRRHAAWPSWWLSKRCSALIWWWSAASPCRADGGRTGKGAGFADLELGMLRQFGLVQADTPVVTTVHAAQVVAEGQLPMLGHDWSLTWIVTPDGALATEPKRAQPAGIVWDEIRPEQWRSIPVLRALRSQ